MDSSEKSYPPPARKPKRRLTLQPWATSQEDPAIRKPLVPDAEDLADNPALARLHELEVHLEYRHDKLAQREFELNKRAKQLAEQQRELLEQEALLQARDKMARPITQEVPQETISENQNAQELLALKAELESQKADIEEAKRTLAEREAYIEQCENDLVDKSMLLTEREARIEQGEEDLIKMSRSPFVTGNDEDNEVIQSA